MARAIEVVVQGKRTLIGATAEKIDLRVSVNGHRLELGEIPDEPKEPEAIGSKVRASMYQKEHTVRNWVKIGDDRWVMETEVHVDTTAVSRWSSLQVYEVIRPPIVKPMSNPVSSEKIEWTNSPVIESPTGAHAVVIDRHDAAWVKKGYTNHWVLASTHKVVESIAVGTVYTWADLVKYRGVKEIVFKGKNPLNEVA